jgi:hypothetical protein
MLGPPHRALISGHPPPSRCNSLHSRLPRLASHLLRFSLSQAELLPTRQRRHRMPWPPPPPTHRGGPLPDLPQLQSTPQLASPQRTEAPGPLPGCSRPPERHRRHLPPPPEAELRGRPASDHPSSTRTPPEVPLYFLVLLHHWPLVVSDSPRQNAAAFPLSAVMSDQGLDCLDLKSSRVLSAK